MSERHLDSDDAEAIIAAASAHLSAVPWIPWPSL
jgi:hypothetical protein